MSFLLQSQAALKEKTAKKRLKTVENPEVSAKKAKKERSKKGTEKEDDRASLETEDLDETPTQPRRSTAAKVC